MSKTKMTKKLKFQAKELFPQMLQTNTLKCSAFETFKENFDLKYNGKGKKNLFLKSSNTVQC